MLERGRNISFSDGFISILIGRGPGFILDFAWVVSSDGENIGRVKYLNYASRRGSTIVSAAFIGRIVVVDNNTSRYRSLNNKSILICH